jgi:hypothetical protein
LSSFKFLGVTIDRNLKAELDERIGSCDMVVCDHIVYD